VEVDVVSSADSEDGNVDTRANFMKMMQDKQKADADLKAK
jgi:hypothetical protein